MSGPSERLQSLSSITRGASLFVIGKIIADVLKFLLEIVLSRSLGGELYGLYAYGNTILRIGVSFTSIGADRAVLKYLPQDDEETRQNLVFGLSLLTSAIGGTAAFALLFLFAPVIASLTFDTPIFVDVLRLFAVILVFDTFAKVLYAVFKSSERMDLEVVSNRLLKPVSRLVGVVLALSVGGSLFSVMVALVAASGVVLAVAVYLLVSRFDVRPRLGSATRSQTYEFYNFSVPVAFTDVGDILLRRTDILMVGYFFTSTVVGFYNVSVLVALLLALPLAAFNQLFPPIASRLYGEGDIEQLDSLYGTVTRWTFTASFIVAIVTIVYRREILALFGPEFVQGSLVLSLFVLGQLFNCIGGANGYLLMMTDHQYVLVTNQWVFGLLNVGLNYVFILEFGFVGAAIATTAVLVGQNAAITAELWYLEGLFPYSAKFLKPFTAGGIALVPLVGVAQFLSGFVLVAVGASLALGSYGIALYGLGIEQRDREFFREMIADRL